jgi:hypothetical protein
MILLLNDTKTLTDNAKLGIIFGIECLKVEENLLTLPKLFVYDEQSNL